MGLFVATMPAPYEPAGAPTAEGKSENGDMTWADYADHTRIQKKTNGDIHYIYKSGDHGVQQYSEANNCEITYYLDGRRKQVFPNGTPLEVAVDKTKTQTNPDGVSITTTPNGHAIQKNPNGSSMETHPDSELLVIDFPLDRSPGDEILKWPPIKRVQTNTHTTHYISADGVDIQVDTDQSKIVRWTAGRCLQADKHYAETGQEWCLRVEASGHTTYLVKEGVDKTNQQVSWEIDKWWEEEQKRKAAAAAASAANAAAAQAANDAKKKAARDMLNDPNASSDDLQKMANDMNSIGDDEAKGLSKDLTNKAKEKKMEEDLKRVWEEQADDKMKKFQEMLDSSDDSAANIANTRKAAEEAAKMAATSRSEYGGSKADELDTFASELAAKADDLEKPDPTKIAAMEKCEKYREMLEDAEEKYLPDDYLAAVEEAAALAAELAGNQKCSKERRDAEQFVPLLKAKAVEVEKDIKKRIANKYKSYPWMKMKNFLKKQGVDKDEVNKVLDKYNLWVLAKAKGIPLPDDPADL